MKNMQELIQPELLAIVPVLYWMGTWLKKNTKFPDGKIPLTLGFISIALALLYTFSTVPLGSVAAVARALFTSITQGVLCASASVYTHQMIKQGRSPDSAPPPPDQP